MRRTTINSGGYTVTIYGGGTSVTVEKDGRSFHVQGDDATEIMSEIENAADGGAATFAEYMAVIGEAAV